MDVILWYSQKVSYSKDISTRNGVPSALFTYVVTDSLCFSFLDEHRLSEKESKELVKWLESTLGKEKVFNVKVSQ